MAEPFLAELRLFSFNFPPKGWAFTDGQLLPINQNQALFSLLGTTFGGDGRVTFGLPNLQGRIPAHMGQSYTLGQQFGAAAHTLNVSELPAHNHLMGVDSNAGTQNVPGNAIYADAAVSLYKTGNSFPSTMNAAVITNVGGGQAHLNQQPYLVLNYCIALQGIFPSQT